MYFLVVASATKFSTMMKRCVFVSFLNKMGYSTHSDPLVSVLIYSTIKGIIIKIFLS